MRHCAIAELPIDAKRPRAGIFLQAHGVYMQLETDCLFVAFCRRRSSEPATSDPKMVNPHTESQEEKAEIEHVDHSTDVVQDDAFYEGAPEPTLTLKVYLAMSVSALTRDALHVVVTCAEQFTLERVVRCHHRPLSCSTLLSFSGAYGQHRQRQSCHNDRLVDFPHVSYSLLGLNAVSAHRPWSSPSERPACSSAVSSGTTAP